MSNGTDIGGDNLEESALTHSHIPVKHLLKQLETYRPQRERRDVRPQWVSDFIDAVAELFEPLSDVGRVGFDCQLTEDRWTLGLYLGLTEIVGGERDGQTCYNGFQIALLPLLELLSEVEHCSWNVIPDPLSEGSLPDSFLMIEGQVDGNPIRLQIDSVPPPDAGPGIRTFPDGRIEPS